MSDQWVKAQKLNQTTHQHTLEEKEMGVNVEYFIKNCTFLQGALEEISRRILVSAGKLTILDNFLQAWMSMDKVFV